MTQRLFVAIDLPQEVTEPLAALVPSGVPGIRLAAGGSFHLTLHFIGDAGKKRLISGLKKVEFEAFPLQIRGAGRFRSAGGSVLWADVEPSPPLLDLHGRVGSALADAGVELDDRPYRPHVTFARCRRKVTKALIMALVSSGNDLELPTVPVGHFTLYSSQLNEDGPPEYTPELVVPASDREV